MGLGFFFPTVYSVRKQESFYLVLPLCVLRLLLLCWVMYLMFWPREKLFDGFEESAGNSLPQFLVADYGGLERILCFRFLFCRMTLFLALDSRKIEWVDSTL
ncbi:hypothetical protein Cni_G10913 [Canna indica]|uniref:Uncharacterized protein n=1 Tax=Canna indica TaxID=4628 RepID=A0AAQ3K6R1_9LILI|nr:hypothetical protein Cni_G10913 [Canna indica]